MTTLHLLGTPVLRLADGTAVKLRQKAYAIAALLYLEFRDRARRSALADRTWEQSSSEQALTNLRQTLLHTRDLEAKQGFELFIADTTEIELSRSVALDLREIEQIHATTDANELERLIGLYRGDLLEGVEDYGEGFDQWLSMERTRVEEQFVAQATGAALRIGGSGGHMALLRLAERLPYSEAVCRASIELHLAQGDQAGARNALTAFRSRLSRGLGVEAGPEMAQLLDRRGLPATARSTETAQAGARADKAAFVPRVVLLPPMQDLRNGLPRHLAPALVEDVTIGLSRLRSVSVIAPHTAWQFDPFSALDEVRSHQIDYAVESRVAQDFTGALSLAIRLVRSAGREIVWADKFALSPSSAPERYWNFTTGIARALADSIETAELVQERTARDADAYGHYLSGRYNLRTFDLPKIRRGRNSLRRAREIDPDQASIESALARTYVIEWVLRSGSDKSLLDRAKLHAERAVAIDPADGTAYRELGRVALFDRDIDASLQHMQRAADLAPHHADLLADYADTLTHDSSFDAAEAKMAEALRLNPMPPDEYYWTQGGIHFFRGRFAEALDVLSQMRNQDPALRLMAAAAAMGGHGDLARQYRIKALELQPDFDVARWAARIPQREPSDTDFYVEALRRAGFR